MTRERIAALPADDWRQRSEELREPQLTQHLELVERLRRVAARHDPAEEVRAPGWVAGARFTPSPACAGSAER